MSARQCRSEIAADENVDENVRAPDHSIRMEKVSGLPGSGRKTNSIPVSPCPMHVRTALTGAEKHSASANRADQP